MPYASAFNIAHGLSILVLAICDFFKDDPFYKLWQRMFPPPTPPDKRLVDFMESCRTGRDKVRLRTLLHDREFNPNQAEAGTGMGSWIEVGSDFRFGSYLSGHTQLIKSDSNVIET